MSAPAPLQIAFDLWTPCNNDPKANDYFEPAPDQKLSIGLKDIDDILDGGFDYGATHCITCPPDHGSSELIYGLLISQVCSSPLSTATVIDSTLSFDVRRLYAALRASMKDVSEQEALKILDRIKITKIFDNVGLTEGLAEAEERLVLEAAAAIASVTANSEPRNSTIEDSDDEAEELGTTTSRTERVSGQSSMCKAQGTPPGSLLIIDNIAQIFNRLIKNNYVSGHAAVAQCLQSLKVLTRKHNLCAVLFCSTSSKAIPEEESMSRWKSCTFRPALGDELLDVTDVHIYCHRVPLKERAKGGDQVVGTVLEIVSDDIGERHGGCAAFSCNADGTLGRGV